MLVPCVAVLRVACSNAYLSSSTETPKFLEQSDGSAFAFANHAQQQMFGTDIIVTEPDGFFPAQAR